MNREILSINMEQSKIDIFKGFFALNGLALISCCSEKEALTLVNEDKTGLVILDASTYSLAEVQEAVMRFRRMTYVPILVLAGGEAEAPALEVGADAVISPSIDAHKFFAHSMALIRRQFSYSRYDKTRVETNAHHYGDLVIDSLRHYVTIGEREVHLTPNEYRLLAYFAQNPGIVLSQEQLGKAIWLSDDFSNRDSYRVVSELRNKLGDEITSPKYIQTVHGFGYRFLPGMSN